MGARPIFERVEGSRWQPGDRVVVSCAVDEHVHDVSRWLGELGTVMYLEYSCGAGQTYPDDPMVGVQLDVGGEEEFWSEELDRAPSSRA